MTPGSKQNISLPMPPITRKQTKWYRITRLQLLNTADSKTKVCDLALELFENSYFRYWKQSVPLEFAVACVVGACLVLNECLCEKKCKGTCYKLYMRTNIRELHVINLVHRILMCSYGTHDWLQIRECFA
jgi:hypothetical protein